MIIGDREYPDNDKGFEDDYDRWRDDWADRLDNAVRSLLKAFLKEGYYKDNPERLKEHIKDILESELK